MDTNVLVSAYFWDGNEGRVLASCLAYELHAIISPDILNELEDVLVRKFDEPVDLISGYLGDLMIMSEVVFPVGDVEMVVDDPSDNMVLETALLGKADVIVTGDRHLLTLGSYEGVRILRARDL